VLDPREGDDIAFTFTDARHTGVVLKRLGLRIRVQYAAGPIWIELKDVLRVEKKKSGEEAEKAANEAAKEAEKAKARKEAQLERDRNMYLQGGD
jgi:hypothetical protein